MPRVEQETTPSLIIVRRDSSRAPWHGLLDATEIPESELLRIGRQECPHNCPWYYMQVLQADSTADQPAICDSFDQHNDTARVIFEPPEGYDPDENMKKFVGVAACHPVPKSRFRRRRLF